MTVTRVAYTLA